MDRRTFLVLSGVGALASATPAFLQTRTNASMIDETAIAQTTGYRSVGQVSQLANGHALETQVGNTRLVVIRHPSDAGAVVAVNQRCPHDGCRVHWQAAQGEFVCPCHNAVFSASGAKVRGPMRSGLQRYAARIEGNQVTVQI